MGAAAPPPPPLGAGAGGLGGPGRLGALAGVFPQAPPPGAHPWGQPPNGGALAGVGGLGYLQPGGGGFGDGKGPGGFGLGGGAPGVPGPGGFLGHPHGLAEGRVGGGVVGGGLALGPGGAGGGGGGGPGSRGFDALGMAVGLGGGLGGLFGRTGGGYSFDVAGEQVGTASAGVTPGLSALSMGGSGRPFVPPAAVQPPSGPGGDEQGRLQFQGGGGGRGGEDGGGGLPGVRTKSRFQFVEPDQGGGDPSSAAAVGSFFNQFLPHVNVSVAGAGPGKAPGASAAGIGGPNSGLPFVDPAIMGMGAATPKNDANGDGLTA